jgi:hypothetical protein
MLFQLFTIFNVKDREEREGLRRNRIQGKNFYRIEVLPKH